MLNTKTDCAVVLLWYGKPKLAHRALKGIAAYKTINPEQVLCYDNGSESGHGTDIRSSFPQFKHYRAQTNGGFAGGFNGALTRVFAEGFDSALFLTSDTELTPGAFELILESAHLHRADMIAPKLRFRRPPHALDAWGGFFTPETAQLGHYRQEPQGTFLSPLWDYIPGTAMWISCSAFEQLGGVCEDFFMYWEDADMCVRAHEAGLILARSHAVILHGGGETCAKKPLYTTYYYLRNRLRFCRLHLTGEIRESTRKRLNLELNKLFEKWQAGGDLHRCRFIPPLQEEMSLWQS